MKGMGYIFRRDSFIHALAIILSPDITISLRKKQQHAVHLLNKRLKYSSLHKQHKAAYWICHLQHYLRNSTHNCMKKENITEKI